MADLFISLLVLFFPSYLQFNPNKKAVPKKPAIVAVFVLQKPRLPLQDLDLQVQIYTYCQ